MSDFLYEMEIIDKNGNKILLKTNDRTEYQQWLKEYKSSPSPQKESRKVLLKG